MNWKALFGRTTFMMSLALLTSLGLGLSGYFPNIDPEYRSKATIIILAIMMTFALSRIPFKGINPLKDIKSSAKALFLGVVLASSIPLAASFFFDEPAYKIGLVFIGLTPFAAAVVPLSYIMRGDLQHAARGTLVVYVSAIAYIPAVVWILFGETVPILEVVKAVFLVVLLPLLLSRLLRNVEIDKENMAAFLNSCIFILVFISVGPTAGMFKTEKVLLVTFMGISVARTFGLGITLEYVAKKRGVPWGQRVTDVLMLSYKNKGIAIALVTVVALASLGPDKIGMALFPVTSSIVVEICWVIFMDSVLLSPKRMRAELGEEALEEVT